MKKIIFSGFLAASALTLSAQDVTMYRVHHPNTTTSITTTPVVVPQHIAVQFEANHPGLTLIEWEPMGMWWKATYRQDNRITYAYYNDAGDTYHVALPVLHNSVPEEVVATAIEQYGPTLYGLSTMKDAAGNTIYNVHLIENGNSRMTWIDAKGAAVAKVFRDYDDDESVTMNE